MAYFILFLGGVSAERPAVYQEKRIVAEACVAVPLKADCAVALSSDRDFLSVWENAADSADIMRRSLLGLNSFKLFKTRNNAF